MTPHKKIVKMMGAPNCEFDKRIAKDTLGRVRERREVRIRLDYNADPKNFLQQLQEAINEAGDNEQWLQIDTGFEEEGFSYVTGVYLSYEREKTQEELNQEALDREARIKAVEFKEEQCLLHMMLRNPDMARRLITQLSKEAKDETSPAL